MRSIAPPLSARTAIGTLACPVMMMIGGVTRGCARDGYKRAIERGGPQDLSVFSAGVA